MTSEYILGIDTSNYKTSVAICDKDGNIVCDKRRLLTVKKGERGLRQSEALFQHVNNLPLLMNEIRETFDGKISAVAYSSKPRPVEGSYMPVFNAGKSIGCSIASMLKIPAFEFSHQEGHIEAVKAFSTLRDCEAFLSCHFSGGTTEVLMVKGMDISICGGSKDISLGQVIDRAGVSLGMAFPAGEEMDKIATKANGSTNYLTKIKVKDGWLNLSGIDTQIKKHIENNTVLNDSETQIIEDGFIKEIFEKLSDGAASMIAQASEKEEIKKVIMAGGVSSSIFMKKRLTEILNGYGIEVAFDTKGLSSDNAVGIALLGGKELWG